MLAKLADALCFSSGGLVAVGKLALIATRVVSSSEHTIKVDKSHREAALGFLTLLSVGAQHCPGQILREKTALWRAAHCDMVADKATPPGDTASNNTSVEAI